MFNPIIRGWINYHERFYKSQLHAVLRYLSGALTQWVRKKYKRYENHRRNVECWLGGLSRREPRLLRTGGWGFCRRLDDGSRIS